MLRPSRTYYKDIPFSFETPEGEFYNYSTISDIFNRSENSKEELFRCRTIGILKSVEGKYFLNDVVPSAGKCIGPMLRVSVAYLKTSPQSTVIPYAVQIFGTVQWKNKPVIFAKILQVLTISTAIRLADTMKTVVSAHLAKPDHCGDDERNLSLPLFGSDDDA